MLHPGVRAVAAVFSIRFSTAATASKITKPFVKIPWKYRTKAIRDARTVLIDYLHVTRSLPLSYAENIVNNSPYSLWKVSSNIPFSCLTFSSSFQRLLRYQPIYELEFFFESIGLNADEKGRQQYGVMPNMYFLSDWKQFDVVCALTRLGFPWNRIGLLCQEECSVFEIDPRVLERRVNEIKDSYGFNTVNVIGICLVWPRILHCDMTDFLKALKTVFVDNDLTSSVDGNVDAMLDACRKIQAFYELSCDSGMLGELLGKSKSIIVDYSEDFLRRKIEYFCKLNVGKDEIGLFLLSRPEVFGFDMEERVISVSGFLEHFGMRDEELKSLEQKYPHVFGRNKIGNLPNIMRAMELGEWFFDKMKNGNHYLLNTYSVCRADEELDQQYIDNLMKIQTQRAHIHIIGKLNFLHGIGIGESKFAIKALTRSNSSGSQLQQRFDYLLQYGFEYSKLCAMVKVSAKFLNQDIKHLKRKLDFLCNDVGCSLQHLHVFPELLCYDLEKRIKPRYRLHKWLVEQGYCEKEYSIATIIASSEKTYNARIARILPASAKEFLRVR